MNPMAMRQPGWECVCEDCEHKSSRELDVLDGICRHLQKKTELRTALSDITDLIKSRLGYLQCAVAILNRRTGAIMIKEGSGLLPEMKARGVYMIGEGVTGQVAETARPMIVPRISEEPRFLNRTRALGSEGSQELSFICVPILAGSHALGTLSVAMKAAEPEELETDARLLSITASMISQSVQLIQALDEEKEMLHQENERLHRLLRQRFRPDNIIGNSPAMQQVFQMVDKVAATNATCLILGESGTGKEVFAKTIHFNSHRADRPFVKLNCAALPESILESELFGHEKGAFTGALETRKGRFELADGGTIFLDEIGEISLGVQTKLLRVLQEKEFERVGGSRTLKTDVRVIAATNQDLHARIRSGAFREDLFYRLNVIPLTIPPLRERASDIVLLAEYFLQKFNKENGLDIRKISPPAMAQLTAYRWPGNVRELENVIERAVILAEKDTIHSYHLPPSLQTENGHLSGPECGPEGEEGTDLSSRLSRIEYEYLDRALSRAEGRIATAARYLGLTPRQLGLRLEKHKLRYQDYRERSRNDLS